MMLLSGIPGTIPNLTLLDDLECRCFDARKVPLACHSDSGFARFHVVGIGQSKVRSLHKLFAVPGDRRDGLDLLPLVFIFLRVKLDCCRGDGGRDDRELFGCCPGKIALKCQDPRIYIVVVLVLSGFVILAVVRMAAFFINDW